MLDALQMSLCDTQGQLFELSGKYGYASGPFVRSFMESGISRDMDKEFHHTQWAGKEYLLSRMKDEAADGLKPGEIFDPEVLFWMGYLYRFWHFYTGENSREIYRQASEKVMNVAYFPYHSLSLEMAVDRLKSTYQAKQKHRKTPTIKK